MPALDGTWRIAQANQIREAMGPEFCAVADSLRDTFGAKLVWLKTDAVSMGTPPSGEPIGERSFSGVRTKVGRTPLDPEAPRE